MRVSLILWQKSYLYCMETTAHVTNDSRNIFLNKCNCIAEYDRIQAALCWYGWDFRKWVTIFLDLGYPTITLKKDGKKRNIAIHRLIGMYNNKTILPRDIHVHHIDENKLNSMSSNLELKTMAEHKGHHQRKTKGLSVKMQRDRYNTLLAKCRERHLLKKTA